MTRKSLSDLAAAASRLGEQLASHSPEKGAGSFQGSAHREIPEELRRDIVDTRSQMMECGLYDPVLVRFDSATVAQASNEEIATRLREIGESVAATPAQD